MGMIHLGTNARSRLSLLTLLTAPLALVAACDGDVVNQYYTSNYYGAGGEGGAEFATGGSNGSIAGKAPIVSGGEGGLPASDLGGSAGAGGNDSGIDPRYPDAPLADTAIGDQELDIFGTWGNRYWFAVSDEQLAAMNQGDNGGCMFCGNDGLYHPGGTGKANWVDHLFITTAGDNPQTADYGKVQAKIVGQYSRFPWDENNIPNLNIDADEFVEGQRIAGYEHLRFSNGQRGSIFRDKMAYDLYRMLDYTAPLATYAWVSSNVWGPDVSIPYTLVERYKRTFCERYADQYGGGCPNMWEFVGDFNYGGFGGPNGGPILRGDGVDQPSIFDNPESCQIDTCENTRVKELEAKLRETPRGDGFKAALADYIDWPAFHRFQCLSWVLSTTDDTIHAGNNVVLVERTDGLFQYLPYSIDISMGFGGWGGGVGLQGQNVLAQGCQADTSCWADTLDMCEDVILDLTALEPNKYLKSIYDQLDAEGMLRPGDDANFQSIDSYFTERLANLPTELARYREGGTFCEYPMVDCNGTCMYEYECYCTPPEGGEMLAVGGAPAVDPPAAGGGGPIDCPVIQNYAIAK
jgi:hypothetical protein